MTQAIYALFDKSEAAHAALVELENAVFQKGEIRLIEGGGKSLDEVSSILQDEGVATDEAPIYAQSLIQGEALLKICTDADKETTILDILQRNKATSVKKYTGDRASATNELGEADGWDDFNARPHEHSPDASLESGWTDRNGDIR